MSTWVEPKTNWISSDYLNASDLNRVEGNTDYLADSIANFKARPAVVSIKTDWDMLDFPFLDEMNRLEENINILKDSLQEPVGYVDPVTTALMTAQHMNYIENDLILLKRITDGVVDSFLFVGTFYCGESTEL